eukprot:TRINITY_DN13496_c0_g1_i15.p1 TRINITY_DN13496_c0_g1~~TRINITY_DN13496_c0_g1_i15.p1  ORF type:complete len:413 (+),score=83.43 TRINITY_DN13496_c0_g1_i15:90-1241(+)
MCIRDRALRILPFCRMTAEGKAKAMDRMKQITDRGGTDIALGMKYALAALDKRRYKNKVSSIFLLSDGLDNGADKRCKTIVEAAESVGAFSISTFGYGNDHDSEMMSNISKLKTGKFYYIEKIDTTADCFADSLSALQTVIGQNVLLSVGALPSPSLPGVKIVKAFGAAHIVSLNQQTQEYEIKLLYLTAGVSKNYIFEVSIPPTDKALADNEKNAQISVGRLGLRKIGGGDHKCEALGELYVLNRNEEYKEEEEDMEVMSNYYRVLGAQTMSDAQAAAAQGKHEDAEKMLLKFLERVDSDKYKNNIILQNVLNDVRECITMVKPKEYAARGKHYMISQMRAHMEEESQPVYNDGLYANDEQVEEVTKTKKKRAAKTTKVTEQ